MIEKKTRVLRLFGPSEQDLTPLLKAAAEQGCPGLELHRKNGESVITVTPHGSDEESEKAADRWVTLLEEKLGVSCYGRDEITLQAAMVQAMDRANLTVVAADDNSCAVLCEALAGTLRADRVFDFGESSRRLPGAAAKIGERGEDGLQGAVRQCMRALEAAGSDFCVAILTEQEPDGPAAVLVSHQGCLVRFLGDAHEPEKLAMNWLLDMVRRRALNAKQSRTVTEFQAYDVPARPEDVLPEEAIAVQEAPVQERRRASVPKAANNEAAEGAAHSLYELGSVDEGQNRRRILPTLLCFLAGAAAVAGIGFGIKNMPRKSVAVEPDIRGYGTIGYDNKAGAYINALMRQNEEVKAYLAFSGMGGVPVYTDTAYSEEPVGFTAKAAEEEIRTGFEGSFRPGDENCNMIIRCGSTDLSGLSRMDEKEILRSNYGFTLYTADDVERYKVVSVFYWDENEADDNYFDLYGLTDLSQEEDFLEFVAGVKSRSLFELPVQIRTGDSFASVVTESGIDGEKMVILGRLVREGETASVNLSEITSVDRPLMTAAACTALNAENPDAGELRQYWINRFLMGDETSSEVQEEQGMPEEDLTLDRLWAALEKAKQMNQQISIALLSLTPTATPTPTPEPSVTETPVPTETVTPTETPTPTKTVSPTPEPTRAPGATATPTPTATPKPTKAPDPTATATPKPTKAPQEDPKPTEAPAPAGKTINVTMNGEKRTMDLVECLAMVAQNEMGSGRPAEAYKAQAVATHSWILSMGGYPSVSGITPTASVREAVAQVADKILTYGGSVAFTPYYASCNNGTCASEDVWGGYRAYLPAVESAYDSQVASNWETVASYNADVLADRVKDRVGIDLWDYSDDPEDWFEILSKNSTGYVTSIRVGDNTYTGKYLRENILNSLQEERRGYGFTIRSAAFDVECKGNSIVFTARGYGHCCGLSQWGAIGYAQIEGRSYDWILAHYYPGTSLTGI